MDAIGGALPGLVRAGRPRSQVAAGLCAGRDARAPEPALTGHCGRDARAPLVRAGRPRSQVSLPPLWGIPPDNSFSLLSAPPFPTRAKPLSIPLQPLSGPSPFFVALRGFLFLAFVVLGGSDQRRAMGRMVKPAVLPLILLVAAM